MAPTYGGDRRLQIMHCRKVHEYRLPKLPRFSLDDTKTVYEVFGCFGTGIRASHYGMSQPLAVILWPSDTNAPCRV